MTEGRSQRITPEELIDLDFLDARVKLVEVAAFLDRIDRHGGSTDFRIEAFRKTLGVLTSEKPERARRILELLSDQSTEPAPKGDTQSACGAPHPEKD